MKCQKHWTVSLSVEAFYHPVSSTNYGKPLFSSPPPPALALPNEKKCNSCRMIEATEDLL